MLSKLQRFNVLIGIVLGIAIASLMLLMPQGLGRLGVFAVAAGVFCLCAFAWKPKPPASLNSFALPLLFLVHFNLSSLWLLALLLVAVWVWALTRKSSGDYDFGPGFAIVVALICTVACVVGLGFGLSAHA